MTFQKDLSVPGTHPREPIILSISDLLPSGCNCSWSYHPEKRTKDLKYINMSCHIHSGLAQQDEVRHIYIQDWQSLYEKNNGHSGRKRGRPRKEKKSVGATDIIIER